MKKIHRKIDKLLRIFSKKGITIRELTKCTGISTHSFSNWRLGKSILGQNNLIKLKQCAYSLLCEDQLSILLEKEDKNFLEDFYNEVDNIVRDMPRIGEKEKIVAEIYKESPI